MNLSKEYVAECEQVIRQAYELYTKNIAHYAESNRIKVLRLFCARFRTILSIGSGPYEPILLKASHACDVSPLAFRFLRDLGWKGAYAVCSCDDLPYQDKQFECAVLSEVIEHLGSFTRTKKAVQELARVAHDWIITTPLASKPHFRDPWNIEPSHNLFFSKEMIPDLMQNIPYKFKISQDGEVKHAILTSREF